MTRAEAVEAIVTAKIGLGYHTPQEAPLLEAVHYQEGLLYASIYGGWPTTDELRAYLLAGRGAVPNFWTQARERRHGA